MQKRYFEQLAIQAMKDRGLEPQFSQEVVSELALRVQPVVSACEDLRALLWCSIDNEDSKDLDQLTCIREEAEGKRTLLIAIADVDAWVAKDSPIDRHAQINTTSVYTPAKVFPLLPEELSNDVTSLNEGEDRLALVSRITIDREGDVVSSSLVQAQVRSCAQLAYPAIGAWLEGKSAVPQKVKEVPGLAKALLSQHAAAQLLRRRRHAQGALTLETAEAEAKVTEKGEVILQLPSHNAAELLIEEFMIAANGAMARYLREAQLPSLRRVVRTPKRWDRIVWVAASLGTHLPEKPDSQALEQFLVQSKQRDPEGFPDVSLAVIKSLGRGEYIVEEDKPVGHFALALSEYTHATAPNRRFPDLIVQRQLKAHLRGEKNPYSLEELQLLAAHCTCQEDAAIKVERRMNKVAAAVLLSKQIGASFKGVVTGAGEKGTWVRIISPPVEGRIMRGFEKLDVGDRVVVQLESVNIPQGYINFRG
jgi:VacB/RNase II family 3'-5' exoribonuclease